MGVAFPPGSSGNASWGYDYENRMISSSTPLGSASFVYNGDSLRVRKTEGGVTRNYVFDGVRIYSENDAGMNELNRFMIEGDSYSHPLIALRTSGNWYYPLYDALGSTRKLINSSQTVSDSYSYEAFGGITAQSGSTYNPYKYVGSLGYYRGDPTSGLLHLGARYYNALNGRFTAVDPAKAGHPYGYARSNPVDQVDPRGLSGENCGTNFDWARFAVAQACFGFDSKKWRACIQETCGVTGKPFNCVRQWCGSPKWDCSPPSACDPCTIGQTSCKQNGYTPNRPIYFCPLSFNPDHRPVDRATTVFHEALHLCGRCYPPNLSDEEKKRQEDMTNRAAWCMATCMYDHPEWFW